MEGQTGHTAQQTQLVAQTGTSDGADVLQLLGKYFSLISLQLLPGSEGEAVVWYFCLFRHTRPEVLRNDHDTTGELVKVFELSNRVDVLVEVEGRACWHHPSGPAGV